jgi:hypothetical protein
MFVPQTEKSALLLTAMNARFAWKFQTNTSRNQDTDELTWASVNASIAWVLSRPRWLQDVTLPRNASRIVPWLVRRDAAVSYPGVAFLDRTLMQGKGMRNFCSHQDNL